MYSEISLKSASKRVLARVPINHERVADVSNYISLATYSTSLSLYLSRTYLVVTSHSKRNKLLTTKTKHQSLSHTCRLIMERSECRGKIRPSYNKSASKGNPHSTSTSYSFPTRKPLQLRISSTGFVKRLSIQRMYASLNPSWSATIFHSSPPEKGDT